MIIVAELWFCEDCTVMEVNGDSSGLDDDRYQECEAGFSRLAERDLLPVSANFDEHDGELEFSRKRCDCCGTHLAGRRCRFATLK